MAGKKTKEAEAPVDAHQAQKADQAEAAKVREKIHEKRGKANAKAAKDAAQAAKDAAKDRKAALAKAEKVNA